MTAAGAVQVTPISGPDLRRVAELLPAHLNTFFRRHAAPTEVVV